MAAETGFRPNPPALAGFRGASPPEGVLSLEWPPACCLDAVMPIRLARRIECPLTCLMPYDRSLVRRQSRQRAPNQPGVFGDDRARFGGAIARGQRGGVRRVDTARQDALRT